MNIELLRKLLASQAFEQKLNLRLDRLQQAEVNPVERVSLMLDCQNDPVFFMNQFGIVYEPRYPEMPDIPFFLWDYQRDLVWRMIESRKKGDDILIEKTRDMGITWVVLWFMLHSWLFEDQFYGIIGSRKEEECDNSTPQSLFGKLRYAYYSLPQWIRPEKFRKSEHDLHMKFINPNRMSYLEGESANENFGRGRRASMVFLDEIFFWKFARESWRSSIDASQFRVAVSTASPTSFARHLRDSFAEQQKLLTLDWRVHPLKDEVWYQKEVERRQSDPLSIEGELEIKYVADPEYAYYPEVQNCPVEDRTYAPDLPLYLGLDFGSQDKTSIVYFQRDTQNFFVLNGIEKRNKPLSWYYPFLKHGINFDTSDTYDFENKFTKEKFVLKKTDYLKNELELIRKFNSWKAPVMYCGEAAHKQRMFKSNTSIFQELNGIGVFLRINDRAIQHPVRRSATKKMLTRTIFCKTEGALDVYDALLNSHFPRSRGNSTSDKSVDGPVHDEFSDLRSAVENFSVNIITEGSKVREFVYKKM